MEISILGMPNNTLSVDLQKGPHLSIVDETETNLTKCCDYLILIPTNNEIEVYFIEAKATIRDELTKKCPKSFQQIISTLPIFEYLTKMVEVHYPQYSTRTNKYFVVIGEKVSPRLDKTRVKPTPVMEQSVGNKKFKIIVSTNIPLKFLK